MTIVPAESLTKWRTRSYRSAMLKLANLLELREIVEDAEAEGQRVLMQIYAEAAEAFMRHEDTVRADLATIRRYSPEKLVYWIKSGYSFAHIAAANMYADRSGRKPLELLDEAIQHGGKEGDKAMTVKELIAFATGEKEYKPAFSPSTVLSLLGKIPNSLNWVEEKRVKFNEWLDYGRKEFFS